MYLWGIISLYTTSYYRIMTNNPNFTEERADLVFPLQLLGQVYFFFISGHLYTHCSSNLQKNES